MVIGNYDGSVPFHHFLKQFFSADKKYGSKDRKAITHACYCYLRLGNALTNFPVNERVKAGLFLCNDEPGNWAEAVPAEWLPYWCDRLADRISFLRQHCSFEIHDVFPLHDSLSVAIDQQAFITSHLVQPDLFLRIRPGKKEPVHRLLSAATIAFTECGDDCIALPNSTKADQLFSLNSEVVIQDRSSQQIATFLRMIKKQGAIKIWDCCAASGGKSILAYDVLNNARLTVSDVRPSIIRNLEKRFAEAGIKNYDAFIADLAAGPAVRKEEYDLVICDAPCSGSGTWGRTPEQLAWFTKEKIGHYTMLQRKIAGNVIASLGRGGYFLYITCSVFKEENESVVEYIAANFPVRLEEMKYLEGYTSKADTMFAALFTAQTP